MHRLDFLFPGGETVSHEITESAVLVGSGDHCTVLVPHDSVAMEHVRLTLDVSGYVIADLAGDGSTTLNDYPVEPGTAYQLETGVRIRMGEVEAVYSGPAVEAEVEEEEAVEADVAEALPLPGSFPRPAHPPGVFVPKKAHLNLWMVASVGLAALVTLGAAFLMLQVSGVLSEFL
jgi:pSer/pThr/pTyr-binding forkhead associated (FHA) protein